MGGGMGSCRPVPRRGKPWGFSIYNIQLSSAGISCSRKAANKVRWIVGELLVCCGLIFQPLHVIVSAQSDGSWPLSTGNVVVILRLMAPGLVLLECYHCDHQYVAVL